MYSMLNEFNSVFSTMMRPHVYVVSDSTLKGLQKDQQERTLKTIDERIEDLQAYRKSVEESFIALEDKTEDKTKE